DLAYRNAVELTHARWDSDVQVLVKVLRPYVQLLQKDVGGAKTEPASVKAGTAGTVGPSGGLGGGGKAPVVAWQSAEKTWRLKVAMSVGAIAVAIGGYVVYEKVVEKANQDRIAEAEKVPAGGASGASVPESDVARNGNANIQTNDDRKQDQTNNRNGPQVSSVDLSALPQPVMLVNAKTGKCLTIAGGVSTDNNVEAVQFDCDRDPSRSWTLKKMAGGDIYQIKNVKTGKCLTIAGGESTDNNVTALQFECDSHPSRTWRISDVNGSRVYQIKNVQTGKCLTIAGGESTDNNVTALQFDCDTD